MINRPFVASFLFWSLRQSTLNALKKQNRYQLQEPWMSEAIVEVLLLEIDDFTMLLNSLSFSTVT